MATAPTDSTLHNVAERIALALKEHGHEVCTVNADAFYWLNSDVVRFVYTNGNKGTYYNRIAENDPGMMIGLIQPDNAGKWYITTPANHNGMFSKFKPDAIKFRKINGKTADEVATKFIKWFANNSEAIKARGV